MSIASLLKLNNLIVRADLTMIEGSGHLSRRLKVNARLARLDELPAVGIDELGVDRHAIANQDAGSLDSYVESGERRAGNRTGAARLRQFAVPLLIELSQ